MDYWDAGASDSNWNNEYVLWLEQQLQQNQTKEDWISVEDGLPEDYEWVICGNAKTQKSHYGRYEEDRWTRGREVTHWQPLPQPPVTE